MTNYYLLFYTESSIVCLVIFALILFHDLTRIDRQEKQIMYDHALVAFMLYFISDAFWAAVIAGALPRTPAAVVIVNFTNYLLMAAITYAWFRYVLCVEQIPWRHDKQQTFLAALPFILTTAGLIITFLFIPQVLIDKDLNVQPLYSVFLIAVPIMYIVAIMLFTLREAARTTNPEERRKHLYVGLFPLTVVFGGLLQMVILPDVPIFCFCCAILMIRFYIQAMESRISLDPLTGLNNRGQLMRYVAMHREKGFVVMIDVNDFKKINDNYGHAEGDRALVVIADSLRCACSSGFLGRYGGDEFVLIVNDETDMAALVEAIRSEIKKRCSGLPYVISIGVGYEALSDDFAHCMERADQALYLDKARMKKAG